MVTLRKAIGYKPKEKAEVPEEAEGGEETEADAEEQIPVNICLCVDASLSMVPFEALEEFSQCLSVSRNPCLISFCLLNQQLQTLSTGGKAHACAKDFNKLKYIVDPKGQFPQASEEGEGNICHFFENTLQKQFKEWDGVIGRGSLNVGETYIEQVYDNCFSLMCITPGTFAHVFTPQAIIHTNLKHCKMGFLFDQCIGDNPFLEEKNAPPGHKFALEDHYDISTLLMLQGVKTVVVNSMTTNNLACTKFIESFIESMGEGKGIAASVKDSSAIHKGVPDLPPHIPFAPVVYGLPNLTAK